MDAWILAHLKGNMLTLSLIVYFLKAWAILHPSVKDDQVWTLGKLIYNTLSSAVIPKKID